MTMTLSGNGTIGGLVAGGLPDATITQPDLAAGVVGTGPAFIAYPTNAVSITSGTFALITNDVATNNAGNCYNNTGSTTTLNGLSVPAYSFCPNVAGYYQVNIINALAVGSAYVVVASIYKNGTRFLQGAAGIGSAANYPISSLSAIVYLNGTGDYITNYCYSPNSTQSTPTHAGEATTMHFSASLVRSA